MYYSEYLQGFNFETFINPQFLIPLLVCIGIFIFISFVIFHRSSKSILNNSLNILGYIIYSFIIITVTDYNFNYKNPQFWFSNFESNSIPETIINHIEEKYSDISEMNKDENSENYYGGFNWGDISITPEADNLIDSAEFILQYNLSDEQIVKLKKIMSDPNPDPQNLSGKPCTSETKECKWCGKEFSLESKYYSSKQLLSNIVKPIEDPIEVIGLFVNLSRVDPILCIESYETGNKYQCIVLEKKDFCSLKCEKEYQIHR